MRPALPVSEYYGNSAPLRADRPTVHPAPPDTRAALGKGGPATVPAFTVIRSIEEEPDSAPAASLQIRRSLSRHGFHRPGKFPRLLSRWDAPLPTHIHQIRVGLALRGFTTSVPRVLLSILLAGPAPSGSAGTPRLCQGCSRPPRHLPARAALSSDRAAATTRRQRSLTSTQITAPHGARSPRSTRSRSPSVTDSRQPKPIDGNRRKHR